MYAIKVQTVFADPVPVTFPSALLDTLAESMRADNARVEILDLHASGFDPRFTREGHDHFWGGPVPEDIAKYCAMFEAAGRLLAWRRQDRRTILLFLRLSEARPFRRRKG